MLKVALTGGIATGKSYVRARIAARGVPTLDADTIVHTLFLPGADAVAEVARRFGPGVVQDDGRVDRRALGALVFGDPAARRDLEAIVHPRVYARIAEWAAAPAQAGAPWILADIPLLFETRHEHDFDRVIVARCAPGVQLQRLMHRDGLSETEALARLAAQWPVADKVSRATDVVDTGGTFDDTDQRVDAVCHALDGLAAAAGRQP
jgi:dephospho-CoA kinase